MDAGAGLRGRMWGRFRGSAVASNPGSGHAGAHIARIRRPSAINAGRQVSVYDRPAAIPVALFYMVGSSADSHLADTFSVPFTGYLAVAVPVMGYGRSSIQKTAAGCGITDIWKNFYKCRPKE